MLSLQYLMAIFISSLGILPGTILAYFTKEELEPGKPYFILAQKAIIIMIISVLMNFFSVNLILRGIVYLVLLLILSVNREFNSLLAYAAFGAIVFLLYKDTQLFFIACSLVFCYGATTGTLISATLMKKKDKMLIAKNSAYNAGVFLLVALSLGILIS